MQTRRSVKGSVLEALQAQQGKYLSGEKLSEQLGVSRAAVWKAIQGLREEGYRIDAVTNRGYALQALAAPLSEAEIRRFLPAKYRNNGLYVYEVIDSTNNLARQIAVGAGPVFPPKDRAAAPVPEKAAGAQAEVKKPSPGGSPSADLAAADADPAKDGSGRFAGPKRPPLHGTTVVALQQTAGKGRLGRSFFSPKEGIYLSIIVKPDFDLSQSVLVTVAAAVAVAQAIDDVCEQAEKTRIKWVNDVYLQGKKVCGILTEGITDFESGQIDHLVIGIGVNTTLEGFPEDLKQVAGAAEGTYSRSALAAGIISRVLGFCEDLGARDFLAEYRDKSLLTGRDVRVYKGVYRHDPDQDLAGIPARVLGIDDDGGLQVIYSDGRRETLTTGEVTVRL